ncbi:MAG: threonine synthase [bacterium]
MLVRGSQSTRMEKVVEGVMLEFELAKDFLGKQEEKWNNIKLNMNMKFYSTNNHKKTVNFETALLKGIPSDYGLYMIDRKDIPKLSKKELAEMHGKSYSDIAFKVLNLFIDREIPERDLKNLLIDAYSKKIIPTKIEKIIGKTYIMWLTGGPTYSFKDYAARFYGRVLNYFLKKKKLRRLVIVATSGDTGGAIADALYKLDNVDVIVFYPSGSISQGQRRQMTTLDENVYAFEVNGDFDACQALAKYLLNDKDFAKKVFNDSERFTSANSISIGRLLPQIVYPFYAYSKVKKEFIASIPSGNFGNMMGTVIAKEMGLPVTKIICGVNENVVFPKFLKTGKYIVQKAKNSPSSAMVVSHPSNVARLIDFYNGHIYDKREKGRVVEIGVISKMPNLKEMRKDLISFSVDNTQHYKTMKEVYDNYKIVLDTHGAVGWRALELFLKGNYNQTAVIYETADPGKFPDDVKKAVGIISNIPSRIKKQESLKERIYPILGKDFDSQLREVKLMMIKIFKNN